MTAPRTGRWWWLRPGHERHRCKALRKDPYFPGRCKGMAFRDGLCKLHQKRPIPLCPNCKRPMP